MANYTPSSGNVFKDLGLPEPEEKLAKAKLAYKINRLIATQEMTQKEAAVFLEISRYKMTQLRNGRLNNFTIEHLTSLLEKLEFQIQSNAYDYMQGGIEAYQKGNIDDAINYCNKVIALDPDASTVSISYYTRGVAYLSEEVYESAIKDFNKALELGYALHTDNLGIYFLRGWAYYLQKDYDHAIEDCNVMIGLNSEEAMSYFLRGLTYGKKGELDNAIKDFTKVIKLKSRDAEAYNNRGVAYSNKGELNSAIKDFTRAIKLKPNYTNAYYNRGVAYSNKGELNSAIRDFTEVIKLEPNYINAYDNPWETRLHIGVCEEVKTDLTTVGNMDRNFMTPPPRDYELPEGTATMLESR